jgi:hypothetical protein
MLLNLTNPTETCFCFSYVLELVTCTKYMQQWTYDVMQTGHMSPLHRLHVHLIEMRHYLRINDIRLFRESRGINQRGLARSFS